MEKKITTGNYLRRTYCQDVLSWPASAPEQLIQHGQSLSQVTFTNVLKQVESHTLCTTGCSQEYCKVCPQARTCATVNPMLTQGTGFSSKKFSAVQVF